MGKCESLKFQWTPFFSNPKLPWTLLSGALIDLDSEGGKISLCNSEGKGEKKAAIWKTNKQTKLEKILFFLTNCLQDKLVY